MKVSELIVILSKLYPDADVLVELGDYGATDVREAFTVVYKRDAYPNENGFNGAHDWHSGDLPGVLIS